MKSANLSSERCQALPRSGARIKLAGRSRRHSLSSYPDRARAFVYFGCRRNKMTDVAEGNAVSQATSPSQQVKVSQEHEDAEAGSEDEQRDEGGAAEEDQHEDGEGDEEDDQGSEESSDDGADGAVGLSYLLEDVSHPPPRSPSAPIALTTSAHLVLSHPRILPFLLLVAAFRLGACVSAA